MFDKQLSQITFDDLISDEEKQQLREMLAAIPNLKDIARKTTRLGIDVSEQVKTLEESENKIQKLLAELKN